MSKPKTRIVTYFGRQAKVTEVPLDGGWRETTTLWIDPACERNGSFPAGTVVVTIAKGDARKGTYVEQSREIRLPS